MIPVYKPYLSKDTFEYAQQAFDSTWISSQGQFLNQISEKLKESFEIKHVLMTCNGTASVHLSAIHLKKVHPSIKTIIVPNNVFVSAINGYLYDQQFKLITCDADLDTWNYDLNKLDLLLKNSTDTACLIVHNLGNIINVPQLKEKYPHIVFIEDNCEGLFGKYGQFHTGTQSLNSAISFYGNKNITCGEGGAFFTNDSECFEFLYRVHNCGQSKTRFVHTDLGYNYRMTNVAAAILLKQLEYADRIISLKHDIFARYRKVVDQMDGVFGQKLDPETQNPNWMFGVRLEKSKGFEHADQYFKSKGVEIRPMFYPLSSHQFLHNNLLIELGDDDIAKQLNESCIILPSFPQITNGQQTHILKTLQDYIGEL